MGAGPWTLVFAAQNQGDGLSAFRMEVIPGERSETRLVSPLPLGEGGPKGRVRGCSMSIWK